MNLYSALLECWEPFDSFFPDATKKVVRRSDELKSPGILILWGGSDIHPSIYGRSNQGSYVGNVPSIRDQDEIVLFTKAQKAGLLIVGVCRGAQLGCAMSGGILVQHVEGHEHSHRVTTKDGHVILSSSLHHQMMYPFDIPHELIAWSSAPCSPEYQGVSSEEWSKWPRRFYEDLKTQDVIEPEIVFFPTTRCLAIQGHPEMMANDCKYNLYIHELISHEISHNS